MKKIAPLRVKNDDTYAIQLKLHEQMNKKQIVTSDGRNKYLDDEIKKHSRTSPDVQFKESSLTKQKTRPRKEYE